MMNILNCACRSNFTFFLIFLLFIKMCIKIEWSEYSDFVKYLINSKKNSKKIKFDLQAHYNKIRKSSSKSSSQSRDR